MDLKKWKRIRGSLLGTKETQKHGTKQRECSMTTVHSTHLEAGAQMGLGKCSERSEKHRVAVLIGHCSRERQKHSLK